MSLNSLLIDYKENCKIKNSIIDWKKEENDFKIYVYCLEKIKISIKKKKHLTKLYHKHGLSWIAFDPPEVTKIISMKKLYDSTFISNFKKNKPESFFYL